MGAGERNPDAESDAGAYRQYTRDQATSCSHAVVTAVSDFIDCSPLDLEPLYLRVDPDALDRLVDSPSHPERHLQVEFVFAGCNVEVTRAVIGVGYDPAAARN